MLDSDISNSLSCSAGFLSGYCDTTHTLQISPPPSNPVPSPVTNAPLIVLLFTSFYYFFPGDDSPPTMKPFAVHVFSSGIFFLHSSSSTQFVNLHACPFIRINRGNVQFSNEILKEPIFFYRILIY